MKWELIKERFKEFFGKIGNGIKSFWNGLGADTEYDDINPNSFPKPLADAWKKVGKDKNESYAQELARVARENQRANEYVSEKNAEISRKDAKRSSREL